MGMFAAEPPALLKALADRAAAGEVDDLRLYYYESARIAGNTVLRYELNDRIHPYCMFVSAVERALIKRGVEDGDRKVVKYVPSNFHQTIRLLTEEIGIDTFVCTVSPMDRHGFMSFGTGNDYSTKAARSAKRLLVGVNKNMPRVLGDGARLHVSEVDAIVENHVPLLELPERAPAPEDEASGYHCRPGPGRCLPADGRWRPAQSRLRPAREPQRSRHPHRGAMSRSDRSEPCGCGDQSAQGARPRQNDLHLRHGAEGDVRLPRRLSGGREQAGRLRQ
jgi:Acetyl-CoA hydrolase/transferase N-terminal domain